MHIVFFFVCEVGLYFNVPAICSFFLSDQLRNEVDSFAGKKCIVAPLCMHRWRNQGGCSPPPPPPPGPPDFHSTKLTKIGWKSVCNLHEIF